MLIDSLHEDMGGLQGLLEELVPSDCLPFLQRRQVSQSRLREFYGACDHCSTVYATDLCIRRYYYGVLNFLHYVLGYTEPR